MDFCKLFYNNNYLIYGHNNNLENLQKITHSENTKRQARCQKCSTTML